VPLLTNAGLLQHVSAAAGVAADTPQRDASSSVSVNRLAAQLD
jgi:hypothetical protein